MGGKSRGVVIAALTVALGCVVSVFVLHPFTPGLMQNGLDPSWVAVMGAEADRHARWGVDLAFTYGPASPLVFNYFSDSYFTHTLPLLLGFAFLFGACAVLVVVPPGGSLRIGVAGVLAMAIALVASRSTDAFFFTLSFIVFLLAAAPEQRSGARRAAAMAGGFALGLAAMTKMTFPLAALPLFLLADGLSLARRRMPLLIVPFAIGVVAGDLLYGQRLGDLPAYIAMQGEVVQGYAAAMAQSGPIWDLAPFVLLAAALVATVAAVAWRSPVRGRTFWVVPLGCAIALFVLFKAGFIRHDLHSLLAWRGLVIVAVLLSFGIILPRRPRVAVSVLAVAAFVALVYAPVLTVRQSGEKPRDAAFARLYRGFLTNGPPAELDATLSFLRDPGAFRAKLVAAAADARTGVAETHPLGDLSGSVDMLPSRQSQVLAAGLDYRPRPSFQEYSTYTEGLLAANVAFIEGTHAPDWFLFGPESARGWTSIDGRFPNLAEGGLWPDLMRLYRPDHRIGTLLALKRRADPVSLPIGPARSVTAHFNAEVPVGESTGPVWTTVVARLNPLGQLAALLFRPPLFGLVVRLADGETMHFRFIPALGRAGFVLSPLVFSSADFARLASGEPADPAHRVAGVSLEASRATQVFYDADVRLTFSAIDTSALRGSDPMTAPSGSAWDRLLAAQPGGADESGHIPAEPPAELSLSTAGLPSLTLSYGIDDAAWQEGHTAGVCFGIGSADGRHAIFWQSCLDPLDRPRDRGTQTVRLDVPKGTDELALYTTCFGHCGAGWAYWTKPEDDAAARTP